VLAHTDTSRGVQIADEYRWMETAGAELDPWIDAEDAHARSLLATLPGRAALKARIAELWATGAGDVDEDVIDTRGARTLVMDYSLGHARLATRSGNGRLRVLFDPESKGPEAGKAIRHAATRLSPDGRHVSVGLVERGEAAPRLRIINVASGKWLPEVLTPPLWADAEGFHIAWLPDSKHLLWVRNPARSKATPNGEREFNGHVYVHRLGSQKSSDVPIFGPSLQSVLRADDTPYPAVSADGRWAVIYLRRASGRAFWVAPMQGAKLDGPFREVLRTDGVFRGWGVRDNQLWAITPDGAPRHRIVRIDLRDTAAAPETLLEGDEGVLAGLAVASDAVYYGQRDGATMSLWRLTPDGTRTRIALPRAGNFEGLSPGLDGSGARLTLSAWLNLDEDLAVAPDATEARAVRPAPTGLPPELARYTVSVLQAPARDGVLVPVTVLHARDATPDSTGFVQVEAYGCYGSARTPLYDPTAIAWLERGGTLAIAHVRGGSELGQAWHQAAKDRGRATASDDLVDVVEHLVRSGWAAPGRVSVTGASCGAATVGLAALRRPELIAAASLHVGGVDEWRSWSETASGARSVSDVGDPETALGVRRMVAASPYHQLLPGAHQPAFFLFNGGTDYTIPLWMAGKFVARARAAASPDSGPTLWRVVREAGHSGPTDSDARLDAQTDVLAFELWQLGHPDFQPPAD
jgi:prolyl oligopeptidase